MKKKTKKKQAFKKYQPPEKLIFRITSEISLTLTILGKIIAYLWKKKSPIYKIAAAIKVNISIIISKSLEFCQFSFFKKISYL